MKLFNLLLIKPLKTSYVFSILATLLLVANATAQTIHLKTEHAPPFNIDLDAVNGTTTGAIGGPSTEIVMEMMRRSGYDYTLKLLPWIRAYNAAQEEAYTGVFSTTRTPQREDLFKWVGPVAEINFVLMGIKGRQITINSFEEAKNYRIGAYIGDVSQSILESKGIKPELVRADHLNLLKLDYGRLDLWATDDLAAPYLARQYNISNLEAVFPTGQSFMYLAFNKDMPDEIIDTLNGILVEMRKEGLVEKIFAEYK